ncbi:hypothetical protein BGS_0629 [Beggiatoa sp. SS]|nr:hypothetical protein BGS_0629 [Beggiatoa sp. SS]
MRTNAKRKNSRHIWIVEGSRACAAHAVLSMGLRLTSDTMPSCRFLAFAPSRVIRYIHNSKRQACFRAIHAFFDLQWTELQFSSRQKHCKILTIIIGRQWLNL